jgi:hypothetical protein
MARDMQDRMLAEGASPPEPTWWQKMLTPDNMLPPQQQQQPERFSTDFDDE